jgi:hypothetical protein
MRSVHIAIKHFSVIFIDMSVMLYWNGMGRSDHCLIRIMVFAWKGLAYTLAMIWAQPIIIVPTAQ